MAKLVGRSAVEVNINSPKQDHIPIFDETLRVWNTVSSSAITANLQLDQISGSRFAQRDYTFPNNLIISGAITASNLKVLYTSSTELLGIGTDTPTYPLDVSSPGKHGVYSLIGDDPYSGVTVWDGTYQSEHPLRQKLISLDSSMFSVVNRKPYGSVLDDEYYQFVNYLELTNYSTGDDENVYAHVNYVDYHSNFSQSAAVYVFANSEENSGGYMNSVFTNYNISRTSGPTATTNTGTAVLGWLQATSYGKINTGYSYRAQVDSTEHGLIDNYYMFYGNSSIQTNGRINTLRGIYLTTSGIQSGSLSGSLGDYAGVNIADGNITGSNNTLLLMGTSTIPVGNYGIYNTSNYGNYINGNLGVGTLPDANAKVIVVGKVSASQFEGDGSLITGIATTLLVSGSSGSLALNLKTDTLIVTGSENGVTTFLTGSTLRIDVPPGTVSSSAQIDLDGGLYDGGF